MGSVALGNTDNVRLAMRSVLKLFGKLPVNRFGPKLLKQTQQQMIKDGLARDTINSRTNRIRRVFKWGVGEQIVPPETLVMLQTVQGLSEGRTPNQLLRTYATNVRKAMGLESFLFGMNISTGNRSLLIAQPTQIVTRQWLRAHAAGA